MSEEIICPHCNGKTYRKLRKKYDYVTTINFRMGKVTTRKVK